MGWTQLQTTTDGDFVKFESVGQTLQGEWLGIKPGKYENDLGTIVNEGGNFVFSITAALRDLADVDTGTMVKIEFQGLGETRDGREFKKFDVYLDNDEG